MSRHRVASQRKQFFLNLSVTAIVFGAVAVGAMFGSDPVVKVHQEEEPAEAAPPDLLPAKPTLVPSLGDGLHAFQFPKALTVTPVVDSSPVPLTVPRSEKKKEEKEDQGGRHRADQPQRDHDSSEVRRTHIGDSWRWVHGSRGHRSHHGDGQRHGDERGHHRVDHHGSEGGSGGRHHRQGGEHHNGGRHSDSGHHSHGGGHRGR